MADRGHAGGLRLIDYAPFSEPDSPRTACLVEAGQHWEAQTVEVTEQAVLSLLRLYGLISRSDTGFVSGDAITAEVTDAVTAHTSSFAFIRPFRGGEVVPERDTLIAVDDRNQIRTPYDRCMLVMPNLRPTRGHTAVRLARFT